MSLRKIFLLLILQASYTLYAQLGDNGSLLKINIVPSSPEAASLGKYGETPVSLYSGLPNISIPIFEVSGRRLNSSLFLSYHPGGIKVEETASRVGLGWSINASGTISRTIRGSADDGPNGWLSNGFTYSSFAGLTVEQQRSLSEDIANGNHDAETDLYYYNFNGKSGKFYFDDYRNIVTVPFSRIKISYVTTGGLIGKWIITDEAGNTYYFGTSKDGSVSSDEFVTTQSGCDAQLPSTQNSRTAWNLVDFYDLNNEDVVAFGYEGYTISQCSNTTATRYLQLPESHLRCQGKPSTICYSTATTNGSRIKTITTSKYIVMFEYGQARLDLPGDHVLDKILIKNSDGTLLKEFVFTYDYFSSLGVYSIGGYCQQTLDRTKRLKLVSVQEKSGVEMIPPYSFQYETQDLPERLSYAQDHWGLFNGATTNSTLVPTFEYHNSTTHLYLPGANREPSLAHAKANQLKSIKYPTGLTTEFEYELNTALSALLPVPKEFKTTSMLLGNGVSTSYSTTFTVNSHGRPGAFLIRRVSGVTCSLTEITCGITMNIQGVTNPGFSLNVNSASGHVYLPNGTYTYTVTLNPPSAENAYFVSYLEWEQHINVDNKPAGGLRIKSIITKDAATVLDSKYFSYNKPNSAFTSGSVPSYFKYEYPFLENRRDIESGPVQVNIYYSCSFLARSSMSKIPLSTTMGSSVGYGTVTEKDDPSGTNGTTVYSYINAEGLPDLFYDTYPFGAPESRDWMRGLLLSKKVFRTVNNTSQILSKEVTDYEDYLPTNATTTGLTVGYSPNFAYSNPKLFVTNSYVSSSGQRRPRKSIVTNYFYTASNALVDSLVRTIEIKYNNPAHLQKTRIREYTSSNDSTVTIFQYAHEQSVSSVRAEMLNRNFIGVPMAQYRKVGNSNLVNDGYKEEYAFENSKIRKKNILITEYSDAQGSLEESIPASAFVKRATYQTFDSNGNITGFSKEKGVAEAFVWGYNNTALVARIENALPQNVYYTSFEETGNSDIADAKTGSKSWIGALQVDLTGLTPGIYVLSYWSKSGSEWVFQSQNVTVSGTSYTISTTGQIDELRFHPVTSLMTTYTYKQGYGVSSITDVNNVTTYYDYDRFGRLDRVLDEKKNVIKATQYNFKLQDSNEQN